MSDQGFDPGHHLVRRLAEEATAADLFRAASTASRRDSDGEWAGVAPSLPSPSMRALLAYARRDRRAAADFAIAQAIRRDPVVARRYRNLLAGIAHAFSPAALAAASDPVPDRVLGPWLLRVSQPQGLAPVLVLQARTPAPAPVAIEAVGPAGGPVRLELPAPVRGSIQLPLDGGFAELEAFHRLIADPETAIALLP
jgi:hypothetical protein